MTHGGSPRAFVQTLSRDYERLHTAKEDAFWAAYTGLRDDPDGARADLDQKEIALQRFLQDPERLLRVREQLALARAQRASLASAQGASEDTLTALAGWERTLAAHAIDDPAARAAFERIVEQEGALARARSEMRLGYQVDGEAFVEASSVRLSMMLLSDPDEARRRAAWQGLVSIEDFVLHNGFLELVKRRNGLARMLGAEDYYDWKVRRQEGITKRDIFRVLDELDDRTRGPAATSLTQLCRDKGQSAREPWNLHFSSTGDMTQALDPYFPFSRAFERWGRSFAALGIDYNGAELVLDLMDRKGKHENGFMHGPQPAWRDEGSYRPARIQFTANAIAGMVGSGRRALGTLFHEGGHAAHFANIDMPAPCFAQEFAPTSVSFAELQSMFLESLMSDADWQRRYARTDAGEPMPIALIEQAIRAEQPMAAPLLRRQLCVPYAERAIYELADADLTVERVRQVIQETERRFTGCDRSPRPVLSVPHLISGEASAYYHGYILAQVAVAQTRAHFLRRDGHLMDNPRIGPALCDVYWKPGNSRSFFQFVEDLTGSPPSAEALATQVIRSADDAIAQARAQIARMDTVRERVGPVELHARIVVADGHTPVAVCDADSDFERASAAFRAWVLASA